MYNKRSSVNYKRININYYLIYLGQSDKTGTRMRGNFIIDLKQ